jgi:hypothetical protein
VIEPRNVTPPPAAPLHTPLVWAWGGALLTASLSLTGMIAVVQAVIGLFT